MNTLISSLRKERDELKTRINSICDEASERGLSDDEDATVSELVAKLEALNERLEKLETVELRNAKALELSAKVDATAIHVRGEEPVYHPESKESFFKDLVLATRGDFSARDRLVAHQSQELHTRDMSTASGAGGEFAPPQYLVSKFAELARAGRPVANLMPAAGAPSTNVFYVPKITTGGAIAVQASENASLGEQDFVTTNVQVNVATLGGYTDQSVQLLDFASASWDQIVFSDLARAYATQVETAVINRNATGFKGLNQETGTVAVTYTDTTPTFAELLPKLADAIQQIHTNRYAAPTHIVVHPRRWAWMLAALDTTNRPLISPVAPSNNPGSGSLGSAEGFVGTVLGLPVVTSASIPTNLGAGTNEDRIFVIKSDDHLLWESPLKTLVDPYSGSANGTVRLRMHGYVGFTCNRYPKSVAVISGTGLVAPTF